MPLYQGLCSTYRDSIAHNTSGTAEVCQLPAGIAEKKKKVLYWYVLRKELKNKRVTVVVKVKQRVR